MQPVRFKEFISNLDIGKIDIAEENVRKTQLDGGLDALKASIGRLGLIHPVIVVPSGDRYKLIVGQRRLRAFIELGRESIPALVIRQVDSESQRLVSFGENIHRRKLPYVDTIEACSYLFDSYTGSKSSRVKRVAEDLNISRPTVLKYLQHRLVPMKVRRLVDDGKLPAGVAYRITVAFWPNEKRIEDLANVATRLTKWERDMAIDLGRQQPNAPISRILEEARNAVPAVQLSVYIERGTLEILEREATKRETDVKALIRSVLEDWLEEEGLK